MNAFDIIKKPILSEKCYAGIASKRYVFVIDSRANKTEVKKAIEEIYKGVKVEKVNTVSVRGKYKRQGKNEGYTSSFKKAYVQLTAESKGIEFFENLG